MPRLPLLIVPLLLAVLFGTTCSRTTPQVKAAGDADLTDASADMAIAGVPPRRAAAFASLPDRGNLLGYPSQRVEKLERASTWHRADVSEEHALRAIVTGEMAVAAPDGQPIRLRYQRHLEHPNGNWTWIGRNEHGEEAIVTFGEKAVFGSIPRHGGEELRLATSGGRSWVVEADPGKQHHPDPKRPDFVVPPELAQSFAADQPVTASASMEALTPTAVGTTVDVALGYTTGFASELGGDSQAVTRLQHLVDIANQAYANSQINAQIRLVRTVPVNYSDATDNNDALAKLTGQSGSGSVPVDPAFNALRTARDQYGADLVSLVRRFRTPENEGCGVAWLIGGNQSRIDNSDAPWGYSVVSDDLDRGDLDETDNKTYVCRKETLAHELGHNMGQAHNSEDSDGTPGAHSYSYGYREASTTGFYTVMAYRLTDSSQKSIRYFANPNVVDGSTGRATGVANVSDNARSMAQTMPIIALFRSTQVPLDPAATPVRRLADANADGAMDLVWHNAQTGQLYYWVMNGGAIAGGGGGSIPLGYSSLAVADFNGDARADVLITDGGQLRMAFGVGSGGYAAPVAVTGYPGGWIIAGAGDVNADGRSDLIWQHAGTGELFYWAMNGTAIVGGRGGIFMPSGYSSRGLGDFNADGRIDILISNGSDLRLLSATAAGSFTGPVAITGYPGGWTLAGVGDVTADGRADLVWHNSGSGEVYYWAMNGAAIVGGRGGAFLPTGYASRAAGDVNGDGRADLVISNGGDLRVLLAGSSGAFSAPITVTGYPGGWTLI